MVFSLLFLRYQGNHICCIARAILDKSGTNYTEIYIGDEVVAQSKGPVCRLLINGSFILYHNLLISRTRHWKYTREAKVC